MESYNANNLKTINMKILNFILDIDQLPNTWKNIILSQYLNPIQTRYQHVLQTYCIHSMHSKNIIKNIINWYTEKYSILNNNEFGIRKGRSATDLMNIQIKNIDISYSKTYYSVLIAADIKKAYNNINHTIIEKKIDN